MKRASIARRLLAGALLPLAICAIGEEQRGGRAMPLREAIAEALASNPEIQAAKQELEAARQRVRPLARSTTPCSRLAW